MSLKEEFKKADDRKSYYKLDDAVLCVQQSAYCTRYYYYDFLARILTVHSGSSDGGANVIPFSQLDRESLEFMHDKLIELRGKPPALPEENPSPFLKQDFKK